MVLDQFCFAPVFFVCLLPILWLSQGLRPNQIPVKLKQATKLLHVFGLLLSFFSLRTIQQFWSQTMRYFLTVIIIIIKLTTLVLSNYRFGPQCSCWIFTLSPWISGERRGWAGGQGGLGDFEVTILCFLSSEWTLQILWQLVGMRISLGKLIAKKVLKKLWTEHTQADHHLIKHHSSYNYSCTQIWKIN